MTISSLLAQPFDQFIPIIAIVILISILFYLALLIVGQIKSSISLEAYRKVEFDTFVKRSERILANAEQEQIDEYGGWQGLRKFEISRKQLEADSIRSFYLVPHDGKPLPPFRPGQFLTFALKIPGTAKETTVRCYSLSDSPTNSDYYRISIKQQGAPPNKPDVPEGLSSNFFHKKLEVGDILDVRAPSGDFYLDTTTDSPVVLIGGGIGLTPVVSMLNYIVDTGSTRETWFFYGMRFGIEHVWKEKLNELRKHPNINIVIVYSNPQEDDVQGVDYDAEGRIGAPLFKEMLKINNYDYYLCGPPPMMNAVVGGLEEWGVPDDRIHFEAFGPASVKKKDDVKPVGEAKESIEIEFSRSGKKASWDGSHASLLEFAEANDIATIDSGCRAGNCGSCETALRSGEVDYTKKPAYQNEEGSALMCCSVPKGPLVIDA